MSVRKCLFFSLGGLLGGGTVLGTIVYFTDPAIAGWEIFFILYLSLLFFLWGGLFLLLYPIKKRVMNKTSFKTVKNSFRQAFGLACALTLCFLLQSIRALWPWNIPLLVIALVFLEFFFLTKK